MLYVFPCLRPSSSQSVMMTNLHPLIRPLTDTRRLLVTDATTSEREIWLCGIINHSGPLRASAWESVVQETEGDEGHREWSLCLFYFILLFQFLKEYRDQRFIEPFWMNLTPRQLSKNNLSTLKTTEKNHILNFIGNLLFPDKNNPQTSPWSLPRPRRLCCLPSVCVFVYLQGYAKVTEWISTKLHGSFKLQNCLWENFQCAVSNVHSIKEAGS